MVEEEKLVHIITLKSKLRYNFATRSKTNDITKKEIKGIERRLTKELQKQIKTQGHVKTGKMMRTIRVKVKPDSRGRMLVTINAVFYWKYVNGRFDIFKNAQSKRGWKKIEGDFNFLNRGIR